MSTQDINPLFNGPVEELQVITEETVIEHDLGDGFRLEVRGVPTTETHPIHYRVIDTSDPHRETPMTVFDPPVAIFDSEALRDRYAAVVESLVDSDAAATFGEVVRDLGAAYQAGELLILEERVMLVVQSTERVEYDPHDAPPWTVWLTDDHVNSDWGLDRIRIGSDDWCATERPTIKFPTGLELRLHGKPTRWRQLRLLWTLMYARDAGDLLGGE